MAKKASKPREPAKKARKRRKPAKAIITDKRHPDFDWGAGNTPPDPRVRDAVRLAEVLAAANELVEPPPPDVVRLGAELVERLRREGPERLAEEPRAIGTFDAVERPTRRYGRVAIVGVEFIGDLWTADQREDFRRLDREAERLANGIGLRTPPPPTTHMAGMPTGFLGIVAIDNLANVAVEHPATNSDGTPGIAWGPPAEPLPAGTELILPETAVRRLGELQDLLVPLLVSSPIDQRTASIHLRWRQLGKPAPDMDAAFVRRSADMAAAPLDRVTLESYQLARHLGRQAPDFELPAAAAPPRSDPSPTTAVVRLVGYADIAKALGLPYGDESEQRSVRHKLKELHTKVPSPIVFGQAAGQQPSTDRAALLGWWNTLEQRRSELAARRRDADATVTDRYRHGQSAEVVPGIAGGVKKRRSDRRA